MSARPPAACPPSPTRSSTPWPSRSPRPGSPMWPSSGSAAWACAPPAPWSRSPRAAGCSSGSARTTWAAWSRAAGRPPRGDPGAAGAVLRPPGPGGRRGPGGSTPRTWTTTGPGAATGRWRRRLTELTPAEVIDQVVRSGLRGRGGAGYPTGLKWTTVAKAAGQKYVICNADEGDPGAFMDRSVLRATPPGAGGHGHRRLRRRGQPRLRLPPRPCWPWLGLKTAIRLAGRAGLLGADIADTPLFQVELRLGAGRSSAARRRP